MFAESDVHKQSHLHLCRTFQLVGICRRRTQRRIFATGRQASKTFGAEQAKTLFGRSLGKNPSPQLLQKCATDAGQMPTKAGLKLAHSENTNETAFHLCFLSHKTGPRRVHAFNLIDMLLQDELTAFSRPSRPVDSVKQLLSL